MTTDIPAAETTTGGSLNQPGTSVANRNFWRTPLTALAVLGILSLAASSILMVDETEFVIVERLGHITTVYDAAEDPGLHFKLPWPVDSVRRFDRRMRLFDPPGREMFTRDKKNIIVDAYVCWRIAAPRPTGSTTKPATDSQAAAHPVVRFFRSLGSGDVAESRLNSRIRSILNTQIGQVDLGSLLDVADSQAGPTDGGPGLLERLSQDIQQEVNQRADESQSVTEQLGIEVVDVRIKRINLPLGNQQAVFERMKSERRKIADRYRSAGMAENTVIKSTADRQYQEVLARARADAERIRGDAEAQAVSILNAAHARDPEFYTVLRNLDSYRKIINDRTTLVLSSSSPLFQLLIEGLPQGPVRPTPADTPQPPPAAGDAATSEDPEPARTTDSREAPK